MTSTAMTECVPVQLGDSYHGQRRSSENGILIHVESGHHSERNSANGSTCQRTLSEQDAVTNECTVKDLSDVEDDVKNGNKMIPINSPIAIGHIVDIDAEDDGDDDVFDTTPELEPVVDNGAKLVISVDGQYDELSSFTASSQRQEEIRHQEPHPTTSATLTGQNSVHGQNHQDITFVGPCSIVSETSTGTGTVSTSGITLLERLVRTHPIWYLPHIGRVAAVHLLRGKMPGVFIVRRSSQQNSMAISIKLPPSANQDIEHYLVEKTIAGVHLEGSPNYFRELPFLLAYYCENGGELHTTLSLPKAILNCDSLRDLRSLVLLGPEFWSSKQCIDTMDQLDENNPDLQRPLRPPKSPPTRVKEQNLKAEVTPGETEGSYETAVENEFTAHQISGEIQSPRSTALHRRSVSVSGYPMDQKRAPEPDGGTMLRTKPAGRQASITGPCRRPAPFPTPIDSFNDNSPSHPAAPPKKSPQKERSILAKFWSEGDQVDDGKTENKTSESSKDHQERRSFRFRTLFEVGRRPSTGSSTMTSPSLSREQPKMGPLPSLKTRKQKLSAPEPPQKPVPVSEANLATELISKDTNNRHQTTFYVHRRPAPPPPLQDKKPTKKDPPVPKNKPNTDHDYYYFSPSNFQWPSLKSALHESRSVSSLLQEVAMEERQRPEPNTPTSPRRRLLTFKPGSPTGNEEEGDDLVTNSPTLRSPGNVKSGNTMIRTPAETRERLPPSNAEGCLHSVPLHASPLLPSRCGQTRPPATRPPPPATRPPPVLRREKSDLGWLPSSGGVNKAVHTYKTEVPNFQDHHRHPSENKDESFKTCIEELRRRRLESLRQQMVSNAKIVHSRRDGSPHVVSSGTIPSGKAPYLPAVKPTGPHLAPHAAVPIGKAVPSSPVNGVLRAKSTRQPNSGPSASPSRRLSAPNLVELSSTSTSMEGRPVADLLREVRSRQQHPKPIGSNGGVLHTINEGLVTPVARRRHAAASKRHADACAERRLSQSLEDLPTAQENVPSLRTSTQDSGISSRVPTTGQQSILDYGPDGTNYGLDKVNYGPEKADLDSYRLSSTRDEKSFHNETNFQWVSVTSEIRHRQKVAKVTPTQVPAIGKPRSSNEPIGTTEAVSTKYSEYVMLNDCVDFINSTGGNSDVRFKDDVEYETGRYGSIGGLGSVRPESQSVRQDSHTNRGQRPSAALEETDMDDTRSVVSTAGTIFNEPWDSSAWENLLTLASSMDKNTNGAFVADSRSSFAVSTSSAASSNRPSRVESTGAVAVHAPAESKEDPEKQSKFDQRRTQCSNQKSSLWTDRLKKLKENNIPPPLAPRWEDFSSYVPMSSDSSLPTSTPTNSLESKRRSGNGITTESPCGRDDSSVESRRDHAQRTARKRAQDEEDRFHLSPVASPLRFRRGENSRRPDRSKRRPNHDPATKIQECVERLAKDINTFFGAQVQYFIKCTIEGHETDPLIVLGNVRQFMNGLKNYLVKHGECDLHPIIEQERSKLRPTEFLNIDAILEGVLQKIVLAPLRQHLYRLLVTEGSSSTSLETITEHIAIIRNRSLQDFGISGDVCDVATMEQVRNCFRKMQHHYSPLKKLEYLLNAVALAYEQSRGSSTNSGRSSSGQLPCADELLRWIVYLISRCSIVGCEVESIYMWHLLHPALLAGEASYYLTAFSSAVHVLKHVDLLPKLNDTCSLSSQVGDKGEGFIRVAVPDEVSGAIRYHSFPIMPQLTVSRLCRMIARKCGITNPEDYGLYLLVDGYETCLLSTECPELVKEHLRMSNKAHLFAYKRHEAKIAWPKVAVSPRL